MKCRIFTLLIPLGFARADSGAVSPQLPALRVMKASDLASLADTPPPRAPCPASPAPADNESPDAPIVARPNADGILDITGVGETENPDLISNPFRVRYRPQLQVRETPLAIESVLIGEQSEDASAIINGELYSRGDRLEDMIVTAITADSIELRRGAILLEVPVRDQPTILRLPR